MCGIAGSKSLDSGYDLYQNNLTRGYYSSSVTALYKKRGGIFTIKQLGKLEIDQIPKGADYYLFHSRGPTVETTRFNWDDNHPFCYGNFSVAHNGIIENADDLYAGERGILGVDSRIVPYLLDESYRVEHNDLDLAVKRTLERLKGTFGLWILDHANFQVRVVRHDITLFNYGTEFSSSNPGYMKEMEQNKVYVFDVESDRMGIVEDFKPAGKPKYFIPPS